MLKKLSMLFKREAGKKSKAQSLVEYGLILALVSVVAITVLQTMGGKIEGTINKVNSELDKATQQQQETP